MNHNKLKKYRRNASKLLAGLNDREYQQAVDWYSEAHDFAESLAVAYNVKLDKVAQVIAVLSPAVSWELNKKDANNLIAGFKQHIALDVRVSTYGQNKAKAINVLTGAQVLQPSAMKTFAFYTNILTAGMNDNVTVDRHAYKALHNIKRGGAVAPTKKEYEELEAAYQLLAEENNLTPPQFQAVVWVAYKKMVQR